MARTALTDDERIARIAPGARTKIETTLAQLELAQDAERAARAAYAKAIGEALDQGASYRDVEALTGMPRASLNVIVLDTAA